LYLSSLDNTHATTPLTSVLCIVSLPSTNSLDNKRQEQQQQLCDKAKSTSSGSGSQIEIDIVNI
jgi:hypothetical protein